MMGNNQNLFFSPEEKGRAFSDVLKEVQEYISSKYSTLMVEGGNDEVKQQVKRYISKYIADYRITVKGKTREELINDLYTEMAEFSFLTKYIFGTGIEEIDINSCSWCRRQLLLCRCLHQTGGAGKICRKDHHQYVNKSKGSGSLYREILVRCYRYRATYYILIDFCKVVW